MARAAHKPRRNIRQYSPPGLWAPSKTPSKAQQKCQQGQHQASLQTHQQGAAAQGPQAWQQGQQVLAHFMATEAQWVATATRQNRRWELGFGSCGGGIATGNGIRPTRRLVEKPAVAAGQTRVLLVQAVVGAEQDLAGECGHPAAELCWPRAPAPTRAAPAATNPIPTADARAHAAAEGAATTANGGNAAGFNAAT